jgi:type IV pilus assembly protein PilQ
MADTGCKKATLPGDCDWIPVNIMRKKWFNTILLSLTLIACNSSTDPSLNVYINKIKSRPRPPIKPIPQFAKTTAFNYPEHDNRPSPFKAKSKQIEQTIVKPILFNGKRISLNFQDIKVKAVLQLLAEYSRTNIVVSDKVTGNLTLKLNDIPWDQALDIILTSRSLGKRRIGKIMLIAPVDEIIDREKKEFNAQLEFNNLLPLHADLLKINYAKASDIATLLKDQNNSIMSNRGRISVDSRTNTIWLEDTNARLEKIRNVVKQLDVPVKQVLIEARIVNVTKDFVQELGLHFAVSKPTPAEDKAKQSNLSLPLSDRLNLDLAVAPIPTSSTSVGIALAKLGDGILLDLELAALESEGKGEIISSPRLITTNQQTAIIESGEEIPYQEATSSGATAVTFKKAVLSLKVTPQITPDRKILMDLHINQDIPSAKVFNSIPSILTKEIQTSVLISNGQTVVLGGIYKQDKYNTLNRVPFLGKLPVVGALFSNKSTVIKNEELLIFITPRIITNYLSLSTIAGQRQTNQTRG